MTEKISCELIKDLMPNYIEKLTSEETNRILMEHFDSCEDCAKERDRMLKLMLPAEQTRQQNKKLVNYMKKIKLRYLIEGIFLSAGILSVFICLIVDLAVQKQLTWSLISNASILYFYAGVVTFCFSKDYRVIKSSAVTSAFLLPYLYLMERVLNRFYMMQPVHWFRRYAVPISLLWIAILWIVIGVRQLLKANMWVTMGCVFVLCAMGSLITNAIANQISCSKAFTTHNEWISIVSLIFVGLLCLILGFVRGRRQKS